MGVEMPPIDPASRSQSRYPIEDDRERPAIPPPRHDPIASLEPSPTFKDDLRAFVAAQAKAKDAAPSPRPGPPPPAANDVLYVGLNVDSIPAEAMGLEQGARSGRVVQAQVHAPDFYVDLASRLPASKRSPGATKFDLTDAKQRDQFVRSSFPPDKHAAVLELLKSVDAKPQVATMALLWSRAEQGLGPAPSRLVLSGHSTGTHVQGATLLEFEQVHELAAMFPRAAAQVRDVQLSGCSTATALTADVTKWTKAFPNLRSMWGYDGACALEPANQLRTWAAATEPGSPPLTPSRDLVNGGVAIWRRDTPTSEPTYTTKPRSAADLAASTRVADARYARWVSTATDDSPDLTADYRHYRHMATRADVGPADRARYTDRADHLVRIREHKDYMRGFTAEHGATFRAAWSAVGMSEPNPSIWLKRSETLETMAKLESTAMAQGKTNDPVVAKALELARGLRELDPKVMREAHLGSGR